MKAQDLRIGNYVNEAIAGPIKITLSILMHIEGSENYKPIPLTEDILLDLRKKLKSFFDYNLINDENNYFLFFNGFRIYIKYLHQLQNLYFALTSNELEFNY